MPGLGALSVQAVSPNTNPFTQTLFALAKYEYALMGMGVIDGPSNWSVTLSALVGPALQQNYSIELYGAPGRTPLNDLKLLYLSLLPVNVLSETISRLGICHLHSRYAIMPFYSPAYVGTAQTFSDPNSKNIGDAEDTVWVGRNVGGWRESPAPNHSWVEVAHCGTGLPRPFNLSEAAPPWKRVLGPAWFYSAPGSGVSINLGRTVVLDFQSALKLISRVFQVPSSSPLVSFRCPLVPSSLLYVS